jgi:hypothetical protein
MKNQKFINITKLSADEPNQLRVCDVYRVLEYAMDMDCLTDYATWLSKQGVNDRVKTEIQKVLKELE